MNKMARQSELASLAAIAVCIIGVVAVESCGGALSRAGMKAYFATLCAGSFLLGVATVLLLQNGPHKLRASVIYVLCLLSWLFCASLHFTSINENATTIRLLMDRASKKPIR
jgi:hypothetical protein